MSIGHAESPPVAVAATRSPGRHRGAQRLRMGIVVGMITLLAWNFRTITATLSTAVERASGASTAWLLAAVGLAAASVIAFGLLRRRTVRAAGGRLSAGEAVAVSYAAGAVHMTAPGGIVLSTAYVFRRLQRRGVPPAAITWSLAISGVLSSVTLVLLGVTGLAVGSMSGSSAALLPAAATALAVVGVVIVVAHSPSRVTEVTVGVLRRANRLLRRPVDAGVRTLRTTVSDLLAIRPAVWDWLAASAAAAANWVLDLLCLWACAQALGVHAEPWMLLASYALAMAGAGISPLPGGVGIVDGILVLALTTGASVPVGTAVGAVLMYRVISLGSMLIGGWSAVGLQSRRDRTARDLRAPA